MPACWVNTLCLWGATFRVHQLQWMGKACAARNLCSLLKKKMPTLEGMILRGVSISSFAVQELLGVQSFWKIFPPDGWSNSNTTGLSSQQRRNTKGRHAAAFLLARGTNVIQALEQGAKTLTSLYKPMKFHHFAPTFPAHAIPSQGVVSSRVSSYFLSPIYVVTELGYTPRGFCQVK